MPILLSASKLKKQIETKAYAFGVSPVVCILISEYVIQLLREAQATPASS